MLRDLWKMLYWDNHDSFMKTAAMALQNVMDSDMCVRRSFDFSMAAEAQKATISESNVLSYSGSSVSSGSSGTGDTEKATARIAPVKNSSAATAPLHKNSDFKK